VKELTSLALLLGAPVQAAGTRVGVVSDIYADPPGEYVVGLEVMGPNEKRWFLPWVAASIEEAGVLATSPLVFVPVEQIDFYMRHGARLTDADGGGLVVDADGRIARSASSIAVSGLPGGAHAVP
jgi:PRC-barrel domain protein